MANERLHLSAAGRAALQQREGAVLRYYNDAAGNCTYGIGTLAHHGHCTGDELRRPVTQADVQRQLAARVAEAEAAVRRRVRTHQLTQQQFDSLVSFTFNTGAHRAAPVLDAAERGDNGAVSRLMHQYVYVHPRGANGRRLAPVRLPGLAFRRGEEAAPFAASPRVHR